MCLWFGRFGLGFGLFAFGVLMCCLLFDCCGVLVYRLDSVLCDLVLVAVCYLLVLFGFVVIACGVFGCCLFGCCLWIYCL